MDYDIRAISAVKRVIGDKISLMVDANHAYNAKQAIRLGKVIEPHNIEWFEEPVPPEDLAGYKEVKRGISIPLARGETGSTRYNFNQWLEERVVDVIQPDLGVIGGISEFQKIVTLAHTHNIQCFLHVWGSAINLHAALHCTVNLPNLGLTIDENII